MLVVIVQYLMHQMLVFLQSLLMEVVEVETQLQFLHLQAHQAHQGLVDLEEDGLEEQYCWTRKFRWSRCRIHSTHDKLEEEAVVVVPEQRVQTVVLILVVQEEMDYLHLFQEPQFFMQAAAVAAVSKYHLVAQDLLELVVLVDLVVVQQVVQVLHLLLMLLLRQQQTLEVVEVVEVDRQLLEPVLLVVLVSLLFVIK